MEELKPCPFCGSEDVFGLESKMLPAIQVECKGCGVFVDFGYSKFKTKQAIRNNTIKLWNTRRDFNA